MKFYMIIVDNNFNCRHKLCSKQLVFFPPFDQGLSQLKWDFRMIRKAGFNWRYDQDSSREKISEV